MDTSQKPLASLSKLPKWSPIVLLLLLAYGIILPPMVTDAPWLDEIFTYQFSGLGRLDNITALDSIVLSALYSAWPPVYYVLQNIWTDMTGPSLLAINLLPAYFGLISIALMYQLGRLLFSTNRAGVIAATLLGTSVFYLYYLHETRGYTLTILLWIWLVWVYWKCVITRHHENKRYYWLLTLAVVLALYTHTISVVFLGGICAYHLFIELRSSSRSETMSFERWLDITRAIINGGILWVPWLAITILKAVQTPVQTPSESLQSIMGLLVVATTNELIWILFPLILATLLMAKRGAVRFIWVWFAIVFIGIFILNVVLDSLFHARHVMPLIIIVILLATQGILLLDKIHPRLVTGFVCVWVGLGIGISITDTSNYFLPVFIPTGTVEAMDTLTENCIQEDDVVLVSLTEQHLEQDYMGILNLYYYIGRDYSIVPLMNLLDDTIDTESIRPELRPETGQSTLDAITSVSPTIYVFAQPNVANHAALFQIDRHLEEESYEICDLLWQNDALFASVYTQDDNCDELTSCV